MKREPVVVSKTDRVLRAAELLMLLVLILFSFLHVRTGVDFSDTGYGLANFVSFPDLNKTWAISTFLSLVTGKLFTILPFGNSIIGVYAYCTALSTGMVLIIYFLLKKFMPWYFAYIGCFIGLGFSWAPKTCIYHYMSYYLLDIAALLLLLALVKEKEKPDIIKLSLAGILLALAAFYKFTNILDVALIILVFVYGIVKKKNIIKHFLICFISYLITFVIAFVSVELIFGSGSYLEMLTGLSGMSGDDQDYGALAMVFKMFEDYWFFFRWFVLIILYTCVDAFVFRFVKGKIAKYIYLGAQIPGFCLLSIVLYKLGAFNFWYYAYSSIYGWGVFMLIITVALSILSIIKGDESKKLFAIMILVVIFVTPLGSNQGLYTAINNLFMIPAFILMNVCPDGINGFIKKIKDINSDYRLIINVMVLLVTAASLMQGTLFGADFIFREEPFLTGDFEEIHVNHVLKGVRTEKEKAQAIDELSQFVYDKGLDGTSAIFYGNIPMMSYALEMPAANGHCWLDLDSYGVEEMKSDMGKISDRPVIIYCCKDEDFFGKSEADITTEKEGILKSFIDEKNYAEIFRNSYFVMLN